MVVLVTTMFIVVMMVMAVIVMVGMMIMVVVVMVVTVCMVMASMMRMIIMRMAMRGAGIGAAFGIKRRLDLDDARAQSLHHRLDHMIAADAQSLRHELRRQMAIAEMPGDPDQVMRIGPFDLEQRLGRGDHLDQPAVIEHQRVTTAKRDGTLEVEQKLQSTRARHRHAAAMPVIEIEHDSVGRRFLPAMLPENLGGADHAEILSTLASLMISISVGEAFSGAESWRHTFICGARPWALRSSRVSQRS